MSSQDEYQANREDYRRQAAGCLEMADRCAPEMRARWVTMAKYWLRLADFAERRAAAPAPAARRGSREPG